MEKSEKRQVNDMFDAINTLISREVDHLSVYHKNEETQKFEICIYKIRVLIEARTAMQLALEGRFEGYI